MASERLEAVKKIELFLMKSLKELRELLMKTIFAIER